MGLSKLKQLTSRILHLANYDFCPKFNRYVYWIKQPIVWVIAGIIFSWLVGLLVGSQGYVLVFVFLALLVMGLVWPWLSMKAIRCHLILPDGRLWENREVKVIFRVQNYWPLPIFGLMVEGDFLQHVGLGEERIAFSFKRIPAWSETEFVIPMTPQRRGRFPLGDVHIKNGFPFGLMDVTKPVSMSSFALVWPACESLHGHPPAERTQLNVLGSISNRSGNDGETIGVRQYREGDGMRNIHWAQTVRCNRIMVRERQTLASSAATVLIDLSPEHHEGIGIHSSYEWAIRIASSICYQLHRDQSQVGIVCIGIPIEDGRSANNHYGIRNLMDYFAKLPSFEEAKELAQNSISVRKFSRLPKYSGRRFFVGSNRSEKTSNTIDDVERIVLQVNGFTEEPGELAPKTNMENNLVGSDILITSPQEAASQLARGWRRSFSGVAS